jgi:hypothetical protein
MRFAKVVLATGIFSTTVSAQFITGAIAAIEAVVEFITAEGVLVATVEAGADVAIIGEEAAGGSVIFTGTQTEASGLLTIGSKSQSISRAVSGDMTIQRVVGEHVANAGGTATFNIERSTIARTGISTPRVKVVFDLTMQYTLRAAHGLHRASFLLSGLTIRHREVEILGESLGLIARVHLGYGSFLAAS